MGDRPERSEEYQRQFLAAVARAAHSTDSEKELLEVVEERLVHGAKEYGEDSWTPDRIDFGNLFREVEEEAIDEIAWSVLLVQHLNRLDRDGLVERDAVHTARHLIFTAAAKSMEAWVAVRHARSIVSAYYRNPKKAGRPPVAFSDYDSE